MPGDASSLSGDTVWSIAHVGRSLWIGTAHGVSIAPDPPDNRGFATLLHQEHQPDSLPQDYIGSILQDRPDRVWVATLGGLAEGQLDPAHAKIVHFRTIGAAQGLNSEKVNALLADQNGKVWASLSNGIAQGRS